ncbi:MAG: hypothetical protein HC896_06040 [Bacteroidales bacterium]|nr:hypothetical protein [Bacteroidales bacterium]
MFSLSPQEKIYRADSLYFARQYYKAIRYYRDLQGDTLVPAYILKLKEAKCYSKMDDHEKALAILSPMVEKQETQSNAITNYYIEELKLAGKYEIARMWQDKINAGKHAEHQAVQQQSISSILYNDSAFITITPLEINSEMADFGMTYYKDGLFFYSNRETKGKKPVNFASKAKASLYFGKILANGDLSLPQKNDDFFGYTSYEGVFDFFENNSQVVFSRYIANESNVVKDETKITGLKLFTAQVDTHINRTTIVEDMPFNLHGFSVAHPTLNEQGNLMVFVSNLPYGEGGADMFFTKKDENGWSPPKSLKAPVNSPFDELFPHIYNNYLLFFSSDRPGGSGQFDIYMVDLKADNLNVVNLGQPLNSAGDDFNLIVNNSGQQGYFCSNRYEERKEEIFAFKVTPKVAVQDVNYEQVSFNEQALDSIIVENMRNLYRLKEGEPMAKNKETPANELKQEFIDIDQDAPAYVVSNIEDTTVNAEPLPLHAGYAAREANGAPQNDPDILEPTTEDAPLSAITFTSLPGKNEPSGNGSKIATVAETDDTSHGESSYPPYETEGEPVPAKPNEKMQYLYLMRTYTSANKLANKKLRPYCLTMKQINQPVLQLKVST